MGHTGTVNINMANPDDTNCSHNLLPSNKTFSNTWPLMLNYLPLMVMCYWMSWLYYKYSIWTVYRSRECVLFIGTHFSNLYTTVDTPAESVWWVQGFKGSRVSPVTSFSDINLADSALAHPLGNCRLYYSHVTVDPQKYIDYVQRNRNKRVIYRSFVTL